MWILAKVFPCLHAWNFNELNLNLNDCIKIQTIFSLLTEWSTWGEWSSCSKTCGNGDQTRQRTCQVPQSRITLKNNSVCPGNGTEKRICNPNPCPELTSWTPWTPCSKSCGSGERRRSRKCEIPENARSQNNPCGNADLNQRELCNTQKCPVYTEWSEWTECSKSCGTGQQMRERACVLPPISIFLR